MTLRRNDTGSRTASHAERGLDFYPSPPEAAWGLLGYEFRHMPKMLWEPACGDGALVKEFRRAGFDVFASDIVDRGCPDSRAMSFFDEMAAATSIRERGIITNPPFKAAIQFAETAVLLSDYVALLVRLPFLASSDRYLFFTRRCPPSRILVHSKRLSMMHRGGDAWQGKRASSTQDHCWIVWDRAAGPTRTLCHIGAHHTELGRSMCRG